MSRSLVLLIHQLPCVFLFLTCFQTRNRFEGTRSEVEELMNKIRQNPKDHKRASQFTVEGYLYVQEKRPAPFGSSWVKHYCMYRKGAKKFNIIPFEHRSGGKLGDGEVFFLKECTKRHTDSIDRRFCFDIEAADRPGVSLTMQAFSEEERRQWLEVLGGREALFHSFNRAIIPRPEGSKSLPEPLMTYELHGDFIVPATAKFCAFCDPGPLIKQIFFLSLINISVSNHSKQNLMTVANLGVVFGPTLMRPQEETVAAIMDLKFQNIVVEILIENHEKIFRTSPDTTFPEPMRLSSSPPNAPPRQSKRQGQRMKRPVAVYNLCLELEDGDSPNSPKEDTPTSSQDSLSSPSPTTVAALGPPAPDRNHLLVDGGTCGDLAATVTNLEGTWLARGDSERQEGSDSTELRQAAVAPGLRGPLLTLAPTPLPGSGTSHSTATLGNHGSPSALQSWGRWKALAKQNCVDWWMSRRVSG
ncbi:rho GTPase-activating protein 10 [Heterocephalus glaber]|uniref:Rho GTPase-activating protein 10 n=1 Tax=Heterocephalus glaber TaxID=10181 RepID=A0AAX6SGP9_HETGA|nr:rho GTPase-activating protein 10 [Heterocephalus glaber]